MRGRSSLVRRARVRARRAHRTRRQAPGGARFRTGLRRRSRPGRPVEQAVSVRDERPFAHSRRATTNVMSGEFPEVRYATAPDGVSIAYEVRGDGPVDLVVVPDMMGSLMASTVDPVFGQFF